jgi:hypothetical protein
MFHCGSESLQNVKTIDSMEFEMQGILHAKALARLIPGEGTPN